MPRLHRLCTFLEQFAPPALAAEWDNVGLLLGDRSREVRRVMTCLTVTPETAAEAIDAGVELIVTHHPLPFQAVRRITTDTVVGRIILDLLGARVAVYSPHTAFDSASQGINQRLAEGLQLHGITPLIPHPGGQTFLSVGKTVGEGRWGWLEGMFTLAEVIKRLKQFLRIERLQVVGEPQQAVRTVAVACGAAGQFLSAAEQNGCDAMVLGEARFHTCLEAEALGIGLLLPGHFASERFAVDCLADVLREKFPTLEIWASRRERDPIRWE
ncbi:MAG: Nif3-like dinuclear metal center hexameric protein [Pirellulales bacterium]|nr:Nif3-like dinuclear metal center hexameric protein [Pirellulales bacterium]